MKLSLNRNELMEAIAIVGNVAVTRTPKPVLQCVLLEVHNDFALLSATDLEISVRCSVTQIEVEKTGSVLVQGDKLGQIVRESSDEILKFEATDDVCHIRGEDSHFQIFTRDVKDFPPVACFEGESDFEMKVADLRRLTEWTVFAAARENTRYAINGVLWEKSADCMTLVATDGRRLSKATHRLEKSGEDQSIIVPTKALQVMSRVLTNPEGSVDIRIMGNQILLKSPTVTMSSSLLEGHFPKYEDVIPNDNDKRVEFNTAELLSAVRRVALLSNEESKGVKFSFAKGLLTLSSRTPEQGEAVIQIPIEYDQASVDIGFNPVFLIDVLRVVSDERIIFEFKEPNRPGVFHSGSAFLYVVMPVTLS